MYGGELNIYGGTFENSIVVWNSAAKLAIHGGNFEKKVSISAKGSNACNMAITGGEFLARIYNTGKTGFITGGKFHYLRMPSEKYIHPEYYGVKDSITREGRTETAYRIEKRPPSVVFMPDSGSVDVEYDPAGSGTQITAKLVDSDQTTELSSATYKWYQGDELKAETQTVTLNEPGTYKAVATYGNASYEAEYVVKPADISSGYTPSLSKGATFTGFPYGKDFVANNVQLFKDGSSTALDGFTCTVKSTGENIDAGAGSGKYTITGTGNYTGELSGTFDIAQADFGKVDFTVSPAKATYTGQEIKPTVTGTLTTDAGVYTLDPSEYSVRYDGYTDAGEATVTVKSAGKNFTVGSQEKSFTITKAPNIVEVSIADWASGDTASTPSVAASFDAGKAAYIYKVKGAADSAYTSDVPSAPGDYTVKATIPASANYEAGEATADFTIGPMPLTIDSATATSRVYETGSTSVEISNVTFKNKVGDSVALSNADYTAIGEMDDANAGAAKNVNVTVTLNNNDYSLAEDTTATTADITQATAPPQNARIAGYITYDDGDTAKTIDVAQSVADMVPTDTGESLSYQIGTPSKPDGVTVASFEVDDNGLVTAKLKGVEEGDESKDVTLPVTFSSQNYNSSPINIVVVPKSKTGKAVAIAGDTADKTYGDSAFTLTATVDDEQATKDDWYWYSSDPNVLSVTKTGSNTMSVNVMGAGSAMIMAWYEPSDENRNNIGWAITKPITVNKRPLAITAKSQEIFLGYDVPTLSGIPGAGEDFTIGLAGLAAGDSLSGLQLAYSPSSPNSEVPDTYSIVPSGASVNKGGEDVSANYAISYVNGTLEVKLKPAQTIVADDVVVTYGDTGKKVDASVTDPATDGGALSYAVTSGQDCVDVDASTGALTINKAGTATVTVTAQETTTRAQTSKDVTVTIQKAASISATVSDPDLGWSYDGTERRLVVVEGAVTGGAMQYSLDGVTFTNSVPTARYAGDYTVWYKVAGDENYNGTETQKIDVTVYKADPVVDAVGTLTATCGDALESVKLPSVAGGTWSWTEDPGRMVEHAGENNFEAKFAPEDTDNYNPIEGVLVTVNAAKGANSVKVAPKAKTLTYNGKAQALVTAGTAAHGAMLYALDNGEDVCDEPPIGILAGDYKVWYMADGGDDYNDSVPGSVKVTIARASLSQAKVALAQTVATYKGKAVKPAVKSVTLDGATLEAGTDYDVSYQDNAKVGKATVTVTGKGNYTGSVKATFTIKFAKPSLSTLAYAKSTKALKAKWGKVSGAKSYQLQYRVRGAKWKTVTVKGVSKAVKGLKADKLCDVRVRAVSGKVTSAWSSVGRCWLTGLSGVSAKSTKAGVVKVTWKKVAKAKAGYQVLVRYSKNGSVVAKKTVKAGKASAVVKGLTPGKKAWVQVCALRKAGGKLYSSSLTRAKSSVKVAR